MSDQKQMDNDEALKDATRQVVISGDDTKAATDFWRHFEIPMAPELQQAIDRFIADEQFENQDELKFQLCKAIATTDHDAFKDDMFKKIVEECKNVMFNMGFDRDLEKELTDQNAAAAAAEKTEENKA